MHFLVNRFEYTTVTLKAATSVDIPFLKPFCSVTSMLLIYGYWLNLLSIALSSTFGKTVNNEIGLLF